MRPLLYGLCNYLNYVLKWSYKASFMPRPRKPISELVNAPWFRPSRHASRIAAALPRPPAEAIPTPDWLPLTAVLIFRSVVDDPAYSGYLSRIDLHALSVYSCLMSDFQHGVVTNNPMPASKLAQLNALADKLGLTPTSRATSERTVTRAAEAGRAQRLGRRSYTVNRFQAIAAALEARDLVALRALTNGLKQRIRLAASCSLRVVFVSERGETWVRWGREYIIPHVSATGPDASGLEAILSLPADSVQIIENRGWTPEIEAQIKQQQESEADAFIDEIMAEGTRRTAP